MANSALQTTLMPLADYLADPHIEEIMINRENQVWLYRHGRMQHATIDLPLKRLKRLADLLLAQAGQVLCDAFPFWSGVLPQGHRIQLICAPAAKIQADDARWVETVCLAIRKQTAKQHHLSDFVHPRSSSKMQQAAASNTADDVSAQIESAVKARKSILISGGTFTGKTSLLNVMAAFIDADERIITIEDTAELHIPQKNNVRLFYTRETQADSYTAYDLLNATLRMRPDRIIMGELRFDDAFCWLQAANTGHAGTLATLHSDSPRLAIQKLVDMVRMHFPMQNQADIERYISAVIDLIIQVKRCPHTGARYISEILTLKK